MKKHALIVASVLSAVFVLTSCGGNGKDPDEPTPRPTPDPLIKGLTLKNFPVMDGSTSTEPLVRAIACELLGYKCEWVRPDRMVTWEMETELPENFVKHKIHCSQTHGAFEKLISDEMSFNEPSPEIIFTARKMSADEKELVDLCKVELIETPIALDALIFIAHNSCGTNTVTHKQLEGIYTLKTKNWNEVGGSDLAIVPYVRNKNSGSQELMESIVMTQPIPPGFFEDYFQDFQQISGMYPLLTSVAKTTGGLRYTVFYYLENIVRNGTADGDEFRTLSVNGVHPTKKSIANRTYPFVAEVYMVIRADLDPSSMAYKVYEFMKSWDGKRIVEKSEYVWNVSRDR